MTGHVVVARPTVESSPTTASVQSRYRHPGDAIRLIVAGLVLVVVMTVATVAKNHLLGPQATLVRGADPSSSGGHIVIGLAQVAFVVALLFAAVSQLRHRRFRLLATVAASAVLGAALYIAIERVIGAEGPAQLSRNLDHGASGVLAYRLATYWLPVLPGWLCWHLLQRWNYA